MVRFLVLALALSAAGCAAPAWQEDFDRLRNQADALPGARESALAEQPAPDADLERALAQPLDLATLIAAVRARNPELRESAARTRAGIEEVHRASALDDPMFRFTAEGVPLRHPGSLGLGQDLMYGLAQTFPFPGNLSLRSEAALRDAEGLHQRYLDRDRDVISRLRRAYVDYYAATKAIEIHNDHVVLMEATEKISDAKFRNGTVSQQDVLKPQLEQVLLHNDVLQMEQMRGSARATINTLLLRPIDAPLGEPREILPAKDPLDFKDILARAMESRPDLKAAELQVKSTQAMLRLADREKNLPDFSVGVDYMQMPQGPDAYTAMLSINLPWFTGKRTAESRRLEQVLRGDQAALDAARARAMFEVRDAWLRVESARKSAALLSSELLPKTAQTVDVSRASYEKDKSSFLDLLDAERSLRDVKLKLIQAVAQQESALADLERAVGADLRRKP